MRLGQLLATGLLLLGLAGCAGSFTTSADLADATNRVAPIEPGLYQLATGGGEGLLFERADNDRYIVTLQPPQADRAPVQLSVFGPLDGFYVAQIGPQAQPSGVPASFGNFVFSVTEAGSLAIANDLAVRSALGVALADTLGVPNDPPRSTSVLTDNAALNWALIGRAIAGNRAAFAPAAELVPASR